MDIEGLLVITAVCLVWLLVSSAVLYASLKEKWGRPHPLIPHMSSLLLIGLTAYLIMAFTDMESVKIWAFRLMDAIGYLFVFLALLLAVDYSRRPRGWEKKQVRLLQAIALVVVLIALFNPLDLYVTGYTVGGDMYSYVTPQMGWLSAALILFALVSSLFTIILPFQSFTEARGRYHETLTLISTGGFVLLLGAFYLNFDIMDGDPVIASLSLYVVFLLIAYVSSLRLNFYIYEPDINGLNLEDAFDAVIAVDSDDRLVYANAVAERIFSTCFERVNGKELDSVLPKDCIDVIEGNSEAGFLKLETEGQVKCYNLIRFPLRGEGGLDLGTAYMFRDVTDVINYHETVKIAMEKLELLNSIYRHDMLNHLTIIHGYAELASTVTDDGKRDDYLNKIIDGCVTAEGVIDFSRAYKGLGLTLDWIPLRNVFDKAIEEADLGQDLAVGMDVMDVEVFSDSLISRAIYNIIHNGRCHAEGASGIRVSTEWVDSEFRITIEDDGCGIPQEEKELIFRNGYGKTNGFGLFLSKEILEISRARIWEEGEAGARFVIAFPRNNVRPRKGTS